MKYHKIEVKTNSSAKPPFYTGSMLRGAFGYTLKQVTCINPSYKCEGCFGADNCLYYEFYEKKNSFHKFRFDINLGAKNYDFNLYLFEDVCIKLPYILSALEKLMVKKGLGRGELKFENVTIFIDKMVVYENSEFKKITTSPKEFLNDIYCPNIKLKLLTPIRIKKGNRFLQDSIELTDILRSINQRKSEIEGKERTFKLDYEPKFLVPMSNFKKQELVRKSNRQKTKMKMDGVVGEMVVMNLDKKSYELLKLGEIIGVGKQTVMGLGKIEVENLE